MSSSQLQNNISWQLLRMTIAMKHGLMHIAEQHNLTVMQMYTLCLMEADKSIPMNSLSFMLFCDASNVTGIVDRLFQNNYIKREEDQHDRRVKMITLTPKGAKLCEKISESLSLYQDASLKQLTQSQHRELKTILNIILQQTAKTVSSEKPASKSA